MTNAALNPDLFLARRAARSDPRAWEEIVELYGERIYNLCLRFASTPAEAEDLTQDVFVKLYGHLDQYRGEVPLVAWALRLSRNLCIDHYRHHRLRKQSETASDEVLRHMPAADDPQSEVQARERRRLVHRTLAEMAEDLATVVLLRDLQGWSYEEVAGYLEVPLGTVKSRLNRARRELVSRLEARLELPPAAVSQQVSSC
ncbi:MAG TPA: sigma-70 family RNA polymerase sigma factor [Thermoanaerobaculia bacterium]|jgi:RNA polymerase sigma-70 factor (ECF subfamily)